MKVSLVSTCMNRNLFLNDSIPNWLSFDYFGEIVIVDWSSKQPVSNLLRKFADPRIKVLRVEKQTLFNLCIARNLGLEFCSGEWIVATDSDITFAKGFFDSFDPNHDVTYRGGRVNPAGTTGTIFMHRDVLLATCGYNELIYGYGGDDDDFYRRIRKHGYETRVLLKGALYHRDHSDFDRLEHRRGGHRTLRDSYWKENRGLPQWNCESERYSITYEVWQYLEDRGVINHGRRER